MSKEAKKPPMSGTEEMEMDSEELERCFQDTIPLRDFMKAKGWDPKHAAGVVCAFIVMMAKTQSTDERLAIQRFKETVDAMFKLESEHLS